MTPLSSAVGEAIASKPLLNTNFGEKYKKYNAKHLVFRKDFFWGNINESVSPPFWREVVVRLLAQASACA